MLIFFKSNARHREEERGNNPGVAAGLVKGGNESRSWILSFERAERKQLKVQYLI